MILLFKASLVIVFMLAFYKLFLEKESFFSANRVYLLGCLVMACILPFIVLPKMIQHQGLVDNLFEARSVTTVNSEAPEKPVAQIDASNLSENEGSKEALTNSGIANSKSNLNDEELSFQENKIHEFSETSVQRGLPFYLFIIYLFGVVVLILNLLAQIGNIILKAIKNNDQIEDEGNIIVNMTGDVEPCSFFNYIFINPANYDFETYEQIIAHEKVHVAKKHSIDLLLSEIAIIILWFNPFIWLMRREVEKNIEYQTDDTLLKNEADIKEIYQLNLVKIACNTSPMAITTNYNQSLIKQRIVRMNTKRSNNFSYWKYTFCLPLVFLLSLFLNRPMEANAQLSNIIIPGTDNQIEKSNNESGLVIDNNLLDSESQAQQSKQTEKLSKLANSENDVPSNNSTQILDSKTLVGCEEFEKAVAAGDLVKVKEILKTLDPDCLKITKNEKSNLMAVEKLVSEKKNEIGQRRRELRHKIDNEIDVCERLRIAVNEKNIYKTKSILQNENINCLRDVNGGPTNDIALIKGLLSYDAKINIYKGSFISISNIGFEIGIDDYEASYCKDPKYLKLVLAIQEKDEAAIRRILAEGGMTCPLNENGVRNDFIFIKELMKYDPIIKNNNGHGITVGGVGIEIDMDLFNSDLDNQSKKTHEAYRAQEDMLKAIEKSLSNSPPENVEITCLDLIDAILVNDNTLAEDIMQEIKLDCFHRVTRTLSSEGEQFSTFTLNTPLIAAVRNQNKHMVKLLLKNGADINYSGDGKETAVVACAKLGNKDIIQLLVNTGADINRKDEAGFTALDYARLNGYDDLFDFLKSIGAR